MKFYSMKFNGSDVKEIPIGDFEENESIDTVMVSDDECVLVVSNVYDSVNERIAYYLKKVDAEGNEVFKRDISEDLNLNTDNSCINDALTDKKGRIIIAAANTVYVFDENAKLSGKVKGEVSNLEGLAKTKDGKIICGCSLEKGAAVQEIKTDSKKFGKTYELGVPFSGGGNSLIDGIEYDFYYRQDSGIFGYDMSTKKSTQVVDFIASNMISDETWNIIPIADNQLIGSSFGSNDTKIKLYSKADSSMFTDKEIITFGTMNVEDSVKSAVMEFNNDSKDYRIQIIDYSEAENPELKLNTDIVSGNIPDILNFSYSSVDMYAAKGLLEDLMPYFEEDSEISTDDILPSVLEAMKTGNQLYYVSPSFEISTLVAKTSDVGKTMGWDFKDMNALLEEKNEGTRLFYDNYKSSLLYNFSYIFDDFVDWQKGECYFDSQEFKAILELCNTGEEGEPTYNEDRDYVGPYQRGEVLLQTGVITMEEILLYKQMFREDITFIGYPNKDKSGSYFMFDQQIGISSKSEHKDAAWEFIRILMSKEFQGRNGNISFMPTRIDCYEMMIKAKTTTEKYTDELGQEVLPLEGEYGIDNLYVNMSPLSKEDVEQFNELINSTYKKKSFETKIFDIINEEAQAYFVGDKDIDETAKIIQSRVTTYVNENR